MLSSRRLRLTLVAAALLVFPGTQIVQPVQAEDPKPQQPAAPAQPAGKIGKLPHVEFDVEKKQVRVECEALAVNAPLEFFVCSAGTAEHEAVLRSQAKPSHIHTALLAIGLKPGQPLTFLEATKKWMPPQGPPLHITVEYEKDGKTVSYPAYRWLRDVKTKKEPRAFTWIFCGSRITPNGTYGADDTGYMVTVVNFDYAMIDIPELASSANDTLEWERNDKLMPPKGTKVWMVIEPAGKGAAAPVNAANTPLAPGDPATRPANAADANAGLSDVQIDEKKVQALLDYNAKMMAPRQKALKEAAEAHYKVIADLRKEQQRLITEADRIQRAIDQIEKEWSDAVTPRPEIEEPKQPGPNSALQP
jgi:hypothetical protein